MSHKTVGVRYCGGCNPRYDRVGFVKKLTADFPEIDFVIAQPGVEYDAVLVICGCLAQCADYSGIQGRLGTLLVGDADHFNNAEALLCRVKESSSSYGLEKLL